MGTKSSKNERLSSTASRKRCSQDDLQSRATQQTDESSLPPTPIGTANYAVSSTLKSRLNSGQSGVPILNSRWPSMLSSNDSPMEVLNPSRHYFQDSQPWPPATTDGSNNNNNNKTTPPVKLPQNNQGSTLQQESDEASYLAKMYDSRTWEMYHRITEARKNSSYKNKNNNAAPSMIPKSESTSEWENLQQEEDANESGHEMFFLFDFE